MKCMSKLQTFTKFTCKKLDQTRQKSTKKDLPNLRRIQFNCPGVNNIIRQSKEKLSSQTEKQSCVDQICNNKGISIELIKNCFFLRQISMIKKSLID